MPELRNIVICNTRIDIVCFPSNIMFKLSYELTKYKWQGPLLICLLNLTLNQKSASHSLQFMLKYYIFLNQLSMQNPDHIYRSSWCGGHILYCSRIRKNVSENREQIDRQTENRESNYRGHSNRRWIVGLRGPTD